MSKWKEVGNWLKDNAGHGVGLVGSLLTGNVKGAIASGMSLVSSATGTDDPDKALQVLQSDPNAVLELKELQFKEKDSIRQHLREIKEMDLENEQISHHETQETIRAGDKADVWYVKAIRPVHATISLGGALYYALCTVSPEITVLTALLTLPFTYMGLRQHTKWMGSVGGAMSALGKAKKKS